MIEFEARFSLDRDLKEELFKLGFSFITKKKMADIIFEPKDWIPGTGLKKGYFVARIRLVEREKPRAEIKEYLDDMRWDESSFEILEPQKFVNFISKIMTPRRVIGKLRETWRKEGIEIAIDEVEGEEKIVTQTISALGFDLKNKKPNYGSMLFYLEREGKIKFSMDEISKALRTFAY